MQAATSWEAASGGLACFFSLYMHGMTNKIFAGTQTGFYFLVVSHPLCRSILLLTVACRCPCSGARFSFSSAIYSFMYQNCIHAAFRNVNNKHCKDSELHLCYKTVLKLQLHYSYGPVRTAPVHYAVITSMSRASLHWRHIRGAILVLLRSCWQLAVYCMQNGEKHWQHEKNRS